MKRSFPSFLSRSVRSLGGVWASALASVLVAYLFVGTCGGGKSGFVLALRAGKVAVTAAWCEPATPKT